MAPRKRAVTSPKKNVSRQTSLTFKATKRGIVPPKHKAKFKARAGFEAREDSSPSSHSSDYEFEKHVNTDVLDVNDKAGQYRRYYKDAQRALGDVPPVHAIGQSKVEKMLRVFDNTYDYGPCVGLTRLERWERAEAMGLNPPPEVRDILMTNEGKTKTEFMHPVFYHYADVL